MRSFLSRLFRLGKQQFIDEEAVVQEYWQLDFSKPEQLRFECEHTETYSIKATQDALYLHLKKKQIYAWSLDTRYRYRDFVLEADIVLENSNEANVIINDTSTHAGEQASGFLFRYISESSFYSVLVSNKGFVRMDAVFNGNPMPILGWTEIPKVPPAFEPSKKKFNANIKSDKEIYSLKIIARATSFTIILNNRWIAEIFDDTIQSPGKIAFAGQNWGVLEKAQSKLCAFELDSRPYEIEAVHSRWNDFFPVPAESRKNCARTWFAMGHYVPALLEFRKAEKIESLALEDQLMVSKIFSAQGLYQDAKKSVEATLKLFPDSLEAKSEYAGILYLEDNYNELENFLKTIDASQIDESSFLQNLQGHLFSSKDDALQAAVAYERAAQLNPNQALFFLHAGNEYEKINTDETKTTAMQRWLEAGTIFLKEEMYDDLESVLFKIEKVMAEKKSETAQAELEPEIKAGQDAGLKRDLSAQLFALKGKFFYALGNEQAAEQMLLQSLNQENKTIDSAVYYLLGLIESKKLHTNNALDFFRKAYDCNPEYPLYAFRLAESLWNAGLECNTEIEQALALDSENGWVCNLASLKSLAENNLKDAESYSKKALELLPSEPDVIINYTEILRRKGRLTEALSLLETGSADLLHAGANLLVADGEHEQAEAWYVKALRKNPYKAGLLIDRAANCIELDLINEADDLLGRAFEIELSPRLYQLIAYLACKKGEFARAEVALLEACDQYPENLDVLFDLGCHWIQLNKQEKLKDIIARLEKAGDIKRAQELQFENDHRHMEEFKCNSCARSWWVPKLLPPQASLRIQDEPPNNMPAGSCPSCEFIYCIACAKATLGEDLRFRCARCGEPLKLKDPRVIYVLNEWLENKD